MATIEEIDDLSVEIINGVNEEDEVAKETKSSPTRAESASAEEQAVATQPSQPSTVVVSSSSKLEEDSDDEDDDIDETILERIIALHEMFPTCVQNATSKFVFGSVSAAKGLFSFARSASWIFFSTSAILFAPIIFEVERAQMEEMQKQQQRQILLGPGAAMGGGAPPMVPGMAPPPPR